MCAPRLNRLARDPRAGVREQVPLSQESRRCPERFRREFVRPARSERVPVRSCVSCFQAAGGTRSDRAGRGRAEHLDGAWVFSFAGVDVCGWPACEERLILGQGRGWNQRPNISDSREICGRVVKKGILRVLGKSNQSDMSFPAGPLFTRPVPGTNSSIVACRQNI